MTGPGLVTVRETGAKYANTVEAAGHSLMADEPVAGGGANAGPQPFEYVLAGLGACTSMTIRMYADRKGWPVRHVAVDLTMAKIDAPDGKGKIDRIVRRVTIEGDLDAEQRARLIVIAEHCPVHKFLLGAKTIETVAG